RLQLVARAILDVHDIDVGVLRLHLVHKAIPAVNTCAARLVMYYKGNLAAVADHLGHFIRGHTRGSYVVGGGGGNRDVAVNTGVETDDGDAGVLGLLEQGDGG